MSHFLDQCLHSVQKACSALNCEIIVVDNNSKDDSLEMLARNYPEIQVIANKDNLGFSKANNQGIEIAKGKWILLLNPDTVLGENTLKKSMEFAESADNCGALGIRMVNGTGDFLPESKRGLPTPAVAFYKLSGLSKLFKKSKRFNRYHAGHLEETESGQVDILSGAYMFMRKEALEKSGLLDETFFMYGEDIDLSYRIQLAGYTNYYFADDCIIHYKGESTKKSSVNYVFVFYKAMVIFAKKHFGKRNAGLFNLIINLGIYFRASLALIQRFIKRSFLPVFDFTSITLGLYALSNYWHKHGIDFPEKAFDILIPSYAVIWTFSLIIHGAQDKSSFVKALKGAFTGTLFILIAYALLPKEWQFSRLFILAGTAWLLVYYLISRLYFQLFGGKKFQFQAFKRRKFLVLGANENQDQIKSVLEQSQPHIGSIQFEKNVPIENDLSGYDEVVFSASSISYEEIISKLILWRKKKLEFKIAPPNRSVLIGSNSIDTAGDLYLLEINQLVNIENKRKKRIFDLAFSTLGLLSLPVSIWLFASKQDFINNLWQVLRGKKTFVGFSQENILKDHRLPKTRTPLLSPSDEIDSKSEELKEKLNLLYARNYSMAKDLRIVYLKWKKLDGN